MTPKNKDQVGEMSAAYVSDGGLVSKVRILSNIRTAIYVDILMMGRRERWV